MLSGLGTLHNDLFALAGTFHSKLSTDKNANNQNGAWSDGWFRDQLGNLIFWTPSDMSDGLYDMSLMTLPLDAPKHTIWFDYSKMCIGKEWVHVKVMSYMF